LSGKYCLDVGSGTGNVLFLLLILHLYVLVVGFDVGDEVFTSQQALIAIHKKQIQKNEVHMQTNAVYMFRASVFEGLVFNISDVFLFNGYTLLLFMTLWLISQSEDVQIFRVVVVHKEDLWAVLFELPSLVDVKTMSAKMGSGNSYSAFSIPFSRKLKHEVAKRMSSRKFRNQYKQWDKTLSDWKKMKANRSKFPNMWTLAEEQEKIVQYRNPATDRFGPLGYAMDSLKAWLDAERPFRTDDVLFKAFVDRWTYERKSSPKGPKRLTSQQVQILELKKVIKQQDNTLKKREKEIQKLKETIKRQKK